MRDTLDYAEVSVVIPCYDCSETIERAVASVLMQTLLPKEIILIDDHSSDDAMVILLRLEQESEEIPIKVIALEKNSGPSHARNRGWDIAKYPYIAFLDSDDSWEPQKLKIQYTLMKSDLAIALSGHLIVWDQNKPIESVISLVVPEKTQVISTWKILLSNMFKTTSTIMVKSDVVIRFAEEKRYAEEYLFLCMNILDGHKAVRIESPLVRQYKAAYGDDGLSKNMWSMEKGIQDVYFQLYKSRRLSFFFFTPLSLYTFLKFLKRVITVFLRAKIATNSQDGAV